jgi:hypothetical protein
MGVNFQFTPGTDVFQKRSKHLLHRKFWLSGGKKSSSENSKMYLKTSKGVEGMNVSRDDPIQISH